VLPGAVQHQPHRPLSNFTQVVRRRLLRRHRSILSTVGASGKPGAVHLVGAILLEQSDEWSTQRSRYMTLEAISTVSDTATVSLSAVPA
jgi:hypothetical protein